MIFATFFHLSTGYVDGSSPPRFDGEKKPIPACGSDSVAILDGRLSSTRRNAEARRLCLQRGFVGFQIESGSRFTSAQIIRKFEKVTQ
jgi:hypothetical protein